MAETRKNTIYTRIKASKRAQKCIAMAAKEAKKPKVIQKEQLCGNWKPRFDKSSPNLRVSKRTKPCVVNAEQPHSIDVILTKSNEKQNSRRVVRQHERQKLAKLANKQENQNLHRYGTVTVDRYDTDKKTEKGTLTEFK